MAKNEPGGIESARTGNEKYPENQTFNTDGTPRDRRSGALGRREDDNDIIDFDDTAEIRDTFAMAALMTMSYHGDEIFVHSRVSAESEMKVAAEWTWAMADAMMEAR